jgi:hypothetical protein
VADFSVDVKGGKVFAQGDISDVLAHDKGLLEEEREQEKALEEADKDIIDPENVKQADGQESQKAGKLIVEEEREEGSVSWNASMQSNLMTLFEELTESKSQTMVARDDWKAFHRHTSRCGLKSLVI